MSDQTAELFLNVEQPENPVLIFSDFMGECVRAMRVLEGRGRLPEGIADAVEADATAQENGKPKILIGQLDPKHQRFVRFTAREMHDRPEHCGGFGADVKKPADL